MISLDKYPIQNPDVISRIVSKEAVIVIPSRGEVKVINEVGATIWAFIDGSRTIREIAQMICYEYEVDLEDAQNDTITFIEQLIERKAISLSENPIRS